MISRIALLTAWGVALLIAPGCSTLTKEKGSKKDSPWESMQFWKKGYQQPQKMAVLWSHDVLTIAGKPPTRGFGGRIYFYNNKSQTIPVEGELVVHGFDESEKRRTGAPGNQPDKRFRFTEDQFTSHYSESDLGASYSVWIPWDTADGVQKEITLVPTFKSSKGEFVQGDAAKVVLPGRADPKDGFTAPVQTVSYQESTTNTVDGPLPQVGATAANRQSDTMRTTTIQLGPAAPRTSRLSKAAAPTAATNATPTGSVAPATSAAIDQARAQMIADAFRQVEPVAPRPAPTYSAWTPSTVPMSGATAVNANNLMPTAWTQQPTTTGASPSASFVGANAQAPTVPSSGAVPTGIVPTGANDEGYALPPGIQLSPRGTAWQQR